MDKSLHGVSIPFRATKTLPVLSTMVRGWNIFAFHNDIRSSLMIDRFRQDLEVSINRNLNGVKLFQRFSKQQMQTLGKSRNIQNDLEGLFPGLYSEPGWPKVYVTISDSSQNFQSVMASHGPIDQATEDAILNYVVQLS